MEQNPTPEIRQPDTLEDASQSQAAADPKVDQLSPKIAALAKRERAMREQRAVLAAKEAALKAQESEYQSASTFKTSLKERFGTDPYGVLVELGAPPDLLTQLGFQSTAIQDPYVKQMQAKLQALEEANAKTAESVQNSQKQQYEQAVNQIRNETKLLVDHDERFETVKGMGAQDAVVELIEQTFQSTGRLMSIEQAAEEVETYLLEEAMRIANLKKVQSKLNPTAAVANALSDPKAPVQAAQGVPVRTLTNQATTTSGQPLTAKERRARAIAAFKGELK